MAKKPTPKETEESRRVADLIGVITQYDREFAKWVKRSESINKRYRDDGRSTTNGTSVRFNILWSNVQTLVPATFSRLPQPDVSRRFRDTDPVGRVAALILERALEYEVQHYPDYGASMRQSVQDRFLGGRGTTWARYEPHFKAMESGIAQDGEQISEDIEAEEPVEPQEQLDYECSPVDYVHYKDFGHSVARTWEEVTKVWRIVYLYEDAVEERFGEEIARTIPYDASPERKDKVNGGEQTPKQAKIYEIWDKTESKAIWLSKSMNKILDERDDPLKLAEFFPCPRPLYATTTNETLVPVPDFVLYQDQADELNVLSARIDGLVKALQVKGCYDAAIPELARLFSEGTNTDLIPVKNMAAFVEKNGLKGSIDLVDLVPIANALREAYLAMTQIKEYIYEITGISDIVRGQTEAGETLGAQQIKQNFVGLRLKTMQTDVAKFAAELLALKAQIMCAKYSPDTLIKISAADQLSEADKKYIGPALVLLIGEARMQDPEAAAGQNPLRSFRIEVASDSLVQMDEAQDKQDRMEFLKASGAFLKEAFPIIQQAPEAAPLLVQMLKFGVTAFKVGKTIEGDFDQALDALKQQAAKPKETPPDPDLIKIQAQSQAKQAEMQMTMQLEQQRMQMEDQKNQREQQAQAVQVEQQNQLEAQREALTREHEAQLEIIRQQAQTEREQQARNDQMVFDKWKYELEANTKVVVAEMSKDTTLQTTAMGLSAKDETNDYGSDGKSKPKSGLQELVTVMNSNMEKLMQTQSDAHKDLVTAVTRPKKLLRGADGKAIGVE